MKAKRLVSIAWFVSCGVAAAGCGAESTEAVDEISSAIVGSTEPAPNQILVCPDASYGGSCQLLGTALWPYSPGVANDSMSSIKVGSSVRATLCQHAEFGGACMTLPAGARVVSLVGTAVGNDTVSSVRVVSNSRPDCRFGASPPTGWVFLYRDASYNGDCVSLTPGTYYTPAEIGLANDSISSLRTGRSPTSSQRPLLYVELATDSFLGGVRSFGGPTGDNPTLPGWNDVISSLRIYSL